MESGMHAVRRPPFRRARAGTREYSLPVDTACGPSFSWPSSCYAKGMCDRRVATTAALVVLLLEAAPAAKPEAEGGARAKAAVM